MWALLLMVMMWRVMMTKRRVMMMKKKNVKGIKGKEVKRGAQSSAEWVQWPFHLQGGQKRVSSRHAVPSCPTPPFLPGRVAN